MTTGRVDVSVVVPTFREVENIPLLVERVFAATVAANLAAELILVDRWLNSKIATPGATTDRGQHPSRRLPRGAARGLLPRGATLTARLQDRARAILAGHQVRPAPMVMSLSCRPPFLSSATEQARR